jgi:dethiobiotin synthetase
VTALGIFVTGTSTGVGKTLVSSALVRLLAAQGERVIGLKPIATGGERFAPGMRLHNLDALELQAASPGAHSYESINPFCFEPAIAPHIAAAEAGVELPLQVLVDWYRQVTADVDVAVVEGAGGWRVPLHPRGFLSDLPEELGWDVILVVGLTLGCLNHAKLTAEAVAASGKCRLLGWIGNSIDPAFARREENIATLGRLLDGPPLALIGNLGSAPRSPHGMPMFDFAGESRLHDVLRARLTLPRPRA